MLNDYFYNYTENEANQETMNKLNEFLNVDYKALGLTNEQATFIEEKLFETQKEYFKLGFKECFKWIKELNK